MPKNAKVFMVDDFEPNRSVVRRFLEDAGHVVKVEASAVDEALGKIEEVKKEGVNVAVLDNSLGSGGNGSTIAAALREEIPSIKIVSFSALEDLKWADVPVVKPDLKKLVEAVTDI